MVYLTYDEHDFYIGIHAFDPEPGKIRAPFVERDKIVGTDDNIAVFLDTRNDRRTAVELRVNPRGNQADAVYNDSSSNEDFSPDFFYDTAAQITADGWTAEMRVPLSSLRYPKQAENHWGILVWRNYPRDQRYAIHSSPIARGSNCWICQSRELTGLTGLPGGGHFVAAPYVTGQRLGEPEDGPGSPTRGPERRVRRRPRRQVAAEREQRPRPHHQPRFSQVESDVGQIAVNNQFAVFFPEKRPFFLEGLDLFDTPIPAVYTRTITDPRWGLRDTGKPAATTYTVLLTEDEGGGGVIIPGATGNDFAPQDFASRVLVGSLRRDFGASYAGLLVTARENEGGGYNRVAGPDFLWRRSQTDQMTGQLLVSDTETPTGPISIPPGTAASSAPTPATWSVSTPAATGPGGPPCRTSARTSAPTRASCRRSAIAPAAMRFPQFYPQKGLFRRVQPYADRALYREPGRRADPAADQPGHPAPGAAQHVGRRRAGGPREAAGRRPGPRRSNAYYYFSSIRAAASPASASAAFWGIRSISPMAGRPGRDFASSAPSSPRSPGARLQRRRQWLDVRTPRGPEGRLFTAQIERLKVTYNFTARAFLRVIGEYLDVNATRGSTPRPYAPVPAPSRPRPSSPTSQLTTVLFVGYADDRLQTASATCRGRNACCS